jgi:cytoskeletal protein CcmA (bactofilin family)
MCQVLYFLRDFSMFGKKAQPAIKSLIAEGNIITGDMVFRDGLRIDGEVKGNLRAAEGGGSILVISETAVITGEIHADHVILNGKVTGPIYAGVLLELQPKAHLNGDVTYKALEMHQGAIINGQLKPLQAATAVVIEEKTPLKLAANNA